MRRKKKDNVEEPRIDVASADEIEQFAGARDDESKNAAGNKSTDETEGSADSAPLVAEEQVDWKDKFLRAKADAQNLQRRLLEERQSAVRFANADFARSIIEVLDDFERTLQAADGDDSAESVVAGVKLVYEKLQKVLKDCHVVIIDAVGRPFDPNLHEALMQQPTSDHPANTVIREIQKGYKLHDRVIRPARVIVSKSVEEENKQVDDRTDQKIEAET